MAPGQYTLAKGYPTADSIRQTPNAARAHACPADSFVRNLPCHQQVRQGTVVITRADGGPGGRVEGRFDITFSDGRVTGTFSAFRCQ